MKNARKKIKSLQTKTHQNRANEGSYLCKDEKNINMKEANSSLVREQVISEVSEDLADTEVEKFKSLV